MTRGDAGDERSAELAGMPRTGDVIGGKFVVESVLGVGGMGAVLGARHAHLGQRVAIKLLLRDAARTPESVARFLREAKTAVGLQSAHVVRVMDVGTLDDGLPYMVMEHLTGTDLDAHLAQRKAIPVEETVGYVLQAMEAVAEAHAAGLVHRDLKPANIFLTAHPDGSALVKVLDFGISKTSDAQSRDQSLTATAAIMGSPMYMSPEQLRSSKNVDVRTDIWALGTILYELVAGHPPFDDETVTGLCSKIAADPTPALRQWVPDVDPGFEAVVMRCLEKDASRRPQTVGELAEALRPFASVEMKLAVDRIVRIGGPARPAASGPIALGVSGAASDPRVASGRTHSATGLADTVATWNTPGTAKRRRTTAVVAAFVGLAAGIGIVVFALAGRGTTPATALPPTPTLAPAPTLARAPTPTLAPTPAPTPSLAPAPDSPPPSASARPATTVPARVPGAGAGPSRGAARPASAAAAPAATKTDDLLLDRK